MMIFDHWWWLMIPGVLLGLWAQVKLTSTYARYSRVPNRHGMTGAEAARAVLDSAGLRQMEVYAVQGHLTDHYDPLKKALFLSSENYHGNSLAAVGVAAHEAGHALQHQAGYAALQLRMALVPLTGFASQAAVWLAIGGMFLGLAKLALLGIVIYGILAVFHLVTLPVEFNASSRAKRQLVGLGLIDGQERAGVSQVLNAAALTYVAALVSVLLTLLHLALIRSGNDRD